jgi:hypothetical protein
MGGNVIFSYSRLSDRANFAKMVSEISDVARGSCATGESHRLLFYDEDVATPYLAGLFSAPGGCQLIRSTVVTPFTSTETDGCDTLLFREFSPPMTTKAGMDSNRMQTSGWTVVGGWSSNDGRFGFEYYRRQFNSAGGCGAQ